MLPGRLITWYVYRVVSVGETSARLHRGQTAGGRAGRRGYRHTSAPRKTRTADGCFRVPESGGGGAAPGADTPLTIAGREKKSQSIRENARWQVCVGEASDLPKRPPHPRRTCHAVPKSPGCHAESLIARHGVTRARQQAPRAAPCFCWKWAGLGQEREPVASWGKSPTFSWRPEDLCRRSQAREL